MTGVGVLDRKPEGSDQLRREDGVTPTRVRVKADDAAAFETRNEDEAVLDELHRELQRVPGRRLGGRSGGEQRGRNEERIHGCPIRTDPPSDW